MHQSPMKVGLDLQDRVLSINVEGSINALYSPHLRDVIRDAFEREIAGMVVDLEGVNYIDSSGIATLVEAVQLASRGGAKFALAGELDDRIRHMFEITRLTGLFEHYENPAEARRFVLEGNGEPETLP